jgi:glycosyltransferase involved in cell wall biosynthesis
MPLVSIPNAQRRRVANANFVATVHHGIPTNLHLPTYNPRGGYVAFLGRISPEKGPDRAIRIARTLGIPLKIAAKVDKVDDAYFRETIAPLLDDPGSSSLARSMSAARPNSWAKRGRSCSRSIGRSHSAWS